MDTECIHLAVKEETAETLSSPACTAATSCTTPDTSICLLAPESAMSKDSLEDVGLDLAEPFSLGNMLLIIKISTVYLSCQRFILT